LQRRLLLQVAGVKLSKRLSSTPCVVVASTAAASPLHMTAIENCCINLMPGAAAAANGWHRAEVVPLLLLLLLLLLQVAGVKLSKRLSSTPCVVVASKWGQSANMERIMKASVSVISNML
jgi:HSP90 family molecular chaperone